MNWNFWNSDIFTTVTDLQACCYWLTSLLLLTYKLVEVSFNVVHIRYLSDTEQQTCYTARTRYLKIHLMPKYSNHSLPWNSKECARYHTFHDLLQQIPQHSPNIYMPSSLLFLDQDLGSLHFLFANFYFFHYYAWVLSKSKLIAF
jgi:hypothetical protein